MRKKKKIILFLNLVFSVIVYLKKEQIVKILLYINE